MELCVSCTLVGEQMELCVSCTLVGEQMKLIIQLRGVIPICQHLSRKIETMFLKWVIKKRRICTCFDPAVGVQQLETAAPFPDQLLSCRTTPCRPPARFQRNWKFSLRRNLRECRYVATKAKESAACIWMIISCIRHAEEYVRVASMLLLYVIQKD